MSFIIWNKSLLMGIEEIDEQHKELMGIINKVHSYYPGNKIAEIESLIDRLTEFARIHFSTEEKYFEKWNYPYADEHMVEHEKILLKILQFKAKSEKYSKELLNEILKFLKDEWFENHLKKHDRKYSNYFKLHGFIK